MRFVVEVHPRVVKVGCSTLDVPELKEGRSGPQARWRQGTRWRRVYQEPPLKLCVESVLGRRERVLLKVGSDEAPALRLRLRLDPGVPAYLLRECGHARPPAPGVGQPAAVFSLLHVLVERPVAASRAADGRVSVGRGGGRRPRAGGGVMGLVGGVGSVDDVGVGGGGAVGPPGPSPSSRAASPDAVTVLVVVVTDPSSPALAAPRAALVHLVFNTSPPFRRRPHRTALGRRQKSLR